MDGWTQQTALRPSREDGASEPPNPTDAERRRRKAAIGAALQADRRAVLVVNTRARSGAELYGAARRLLTRKGLRLDAAYPVRDPVFLPEIVRNAIADGHKLVIVGGGDGTISSVVDHFAYADAALGILPLGTANSFARAVGLPRDLDTAADVLAATGKVADVDLGRINSDYFANTAAIGLPALVGRRLPYRAKRYLGKAAYLAVGAANFLSHRPFRCTLTEGSREIARIDDALDILIANGAYQGGVRVADEAHVESRDLLIRVVKGPRKANLLRTWLKLGAAGAEADYIETFRASDIVIDTAPRHYVSIDGEVAAQTPIRVSLAPQALLLMVPQQSEAR